MVVYNNLITEKKISFIIEIFLYKVCIYNLFEILFEILFECNINQMEPFRADITGEPIDIDFHSQWMVIPMMASPIMAHNNRTNFVFNVAR